MWTILRSSRGRTEDVDILRIDLGLNHVARKWSEPVDNGANKLIPVPGGSDNGSELSAVAKTSCCTEQRNTRKFDASFRDERAWIAKEAF